MQGDKHRSGAERDWRRAIISREHDVRALALAALLFSLVNWPVQALLFLAAIPASDSGGIGPVVFACVTHLFVASASLFFVKAWLIRPRPVWVDAVLWVVALVWILPALAGIGSAGLLLMPLFDRIGN
jgi:hypothetical protein